MGNFWGDFAGAFQKSYDSAQRNSRENAAAKRDEERFAREKQQWGEQDQQKVRIGAAGWVLDDPTKPDGLMTADDYNRQFAAPPSEKGKKSKKQALPAPMESGNIDMSTRPSVPNADGSTSTVRTIGVEMDGKEYNIPTVSDDGRIMTNDEAVAQFKRSGRHLGAFANAADAATAAQGLHESEAARIAPIAPKKDDFVPIEMNGQIMYAPKGRVKMKDQSEYVADVGRVMMSIDPTVGANMMAAAQTLESNNLKLASQKWGNAVVQAQRLGGDAGL